MQGTGKGSQSRQPRPFVFDYAKLCPGDIVLTRDTGLRSQIIQRASGGRFSHALICTTPPTLTEARLEGVRNISARNVYISDIVNVAVLRLRGQAGDIRKAASDAASYATSFFSAAYDLPQALASVTNKILDEGNPGVFCSELVAKSYKHAGIDLVDGLTPDNITPNDIASSIKLMEITHEVCSPCPSDFDPGTLEPIDGVVGDNVARESSLELRRLFEDTRAAWEPYYGEIRPRNIWDVVGLIGMGTVKDIKDLDRVRAIDAILAEAIRTSKLWSIVEAMAKNDGKAVAHQLSIWQSQLANAGNSPNLLGLLAQTISDDLELVSGQINSREPEAITFQEIGDKGGMQSPGELAKFQRAIVHLYKLRHNVEADLYQQVLAKLGKN